MYIELILFVIFVAVFMIITTFHRDVFSTHISTPLSFKAMCIHVFYPVNSALETAIITDPIDPNLQSTGTFPDIQQWQQMSNVCRRYAFIFGHCTKCL